MTPLSRDAHTERIIASQRWDARDDSGARVARRREAESGRQAAGRDRPLERHSAILRRDARGVGDVDVTGAACAATEKKSRSNSSGAGGVRMSLA